MENIISEFLQSRKGFIICFLSLPTMVLVCIGIFLKTSHGFSIFPEIWGIIIGLFFLASQVYYCVINNTSKKILILSSKIVLISICIGATSGAIPLIDLGVNLGTALGSFFTGLFLISLEKNFKEKSELLFPAFWGVLILIIVGFSLLELSSSLGPDDFLIILFPAIPILYMASQFYDKIKNYDNWLKIKSTPWNQGVLFLFYFKICVNI